MAELVAADRTHLALPSDNVLIGRHSEDGTFHPDIDLAGLEGGRTVSRRHARLVQRNGRWFLQVEPNVTNPTAVAGRPLAAGQEAELNDGDEIQLGRVTLTFRADPPPNPEATVIGAVEPTAELRAEGFTYPLSAPEGRELTVGRHSEDRSYRPDIDLGDLPGGRTVSRRHALLFRRDDRWFLRVEDAVTNPTLLNGAPLAPGQDIALDDGAHLQFGRVAATFHQLKTIATVGDDLVELHVEPLQAAVQPGAEVQYRLTIINHTGHVDWFQVAIEGIPESWYQIHLPDGPSALPCQVRLFHTPAHTAAPAADAVAQLRLFVRPPRDCQSWAGVHPFVISATTQGEPQVRRVATCQVTVGRFDNLIMDLAPEEATGTYATYLLTLDNQGNDLTPVAIEVTGEGLNTEIERTQVALGNCAKDQIKIGARVKHRHWLGYYRDYTLRVKIVYHEEHETRASRLSVPPRIPIWLQETVRRIQPLIAPILTLLVLVGLAFAFLRPPDIKTFTAVPSVVAVGTPVTLSWNVDRAANATLDPPVGNGGQLAVPEGKATVIPTATTRFVLTARNLVGIGSSRPVDVQVNHPPQILAFTVSADHISKEGDPVTLSWKTDGASKVTIQPDDEIKNPPSSGEATVHPSKGTTVYTLIAANNAGSVQATKTIIIDPPVISAFSATPDSVVQGGEVRLRWTAQNFTHLTIKANKGDVSPGKPEVTVPTDATEQIVKPLEDTQYTLTASNAGGSVSKTVTVSVSPMQIAFFKAEPGAISKGEQTMLSWSVTGASSIQIQPGVGAVSPGQTSVLVKPDQTTEYTLTVVGATGKQLQAKTTVTVGPGAVKIDFFTAAPATINKGDQATLTFSVQNAKHITIKGSDGKVVRDQDVTQTTVQGSVSVSPTTTTTYTLTATNDQGPTAQPATVTVQSPTPTPAPTPTPGPAPRS